MSGVDSVSAVQKALSLPGSDTSDYDLNMHVVLAEGRILRQAAVLLALMPGPRGIEMILTKRSSRLRHHPGQIAFPGGKIDGSDSCPTDAALREAREEIGLPPDIVSVIGTMQPHETVTGYSVHPIIAQVRADFEPVLEMGEVEEVFTVPLAHVTDKAKFCVEQRLWLGQWRRYYIVPYGPYYIWGATARILRALADRIA
jgi:8-oxo-dGTP pyrophosphatase MutT (NUDIX family)